MKLDTALAMFPDSGKSERAEAADTIQKDLVNSQKWIFRFSLLFVVAAEVGLWYYDLEVWVRLIVPVVWVGYIMHVYALRIVHELWEINDQLAGRKDEFRGLVSDQSEEP